MTVTLERLRVEALEKRHRRGYSVIQSGRTSPIDSARASRARVGAIIATLRAERMAQIADALRFALDA